MTISCQVCGVNAETTAHNRKYCSYECLRYSKNILRKGVRSSESVRRSNLKKKFGITVEQYDQMMRAQLNRCAICRIHQSQEKRRFAVDHDHSSGKIRGLLCINCNRGLGAFKDSDEMLAEAIEYLRKAGKL